MHEVLSPVGCMESLYQAIHNGADAVYLGIKEFGARKFAKNFTDSELIEAIKLSHLYGVRVYVTMNTLIKDNEVDDFLDRVLFLHKAGVDALIMQDFGMICLVRKMYPNLEIHASTQANSSSIDTIKMFHKLGVDRVVLSRELTLDQIKKIDVLIDLEVFVHGALCISYSGNCLMSSMIGKRSGNRGECTGCCRLPYSLKDKDKIISSNKYLLSTKELNTSYKFKDLVNSNIKSFKIEGRMKNPEYVGFVTKLYRNLTDSKDVNLDIENDKLKTLFNREFTTGNLFQTSQLMNTSTPNHIGLKIGKVVDIKNNKIKIKLDREVNQEDGIRFLESGKGLILNYIYDAKNKLINKSDTYIYVDNKIDLKTYDTVYKTLDKKLNDNLKKYELKKIGINIKVVGKLGERLTLIISDSINEVVEYGNILEKAKTSKISIQRVKEQIEKLGNTPFKSNICEIYLDDDLFISIKELNELRRCAIDKLINIRSNRKKEVIKRNVIFDKVDYNKKSFLTCTCTNSTQIDLCLNLGFDKIYVKKKELFEKYKENKKVYYYIERNLFEVEKNYNYNDRLLVSEYIDFEKYNNIVGNYSLNITNSYTAYYLIKSGLFNFSLSPELSLEEVNNLVINFKKKFGFDLIPEVLIYGKVENMIIKGNILNIENDLYRYSLLDKRNREFDVYLDNNKTYILNYTPIINSEKFDFLYSKRFDFYDEDEQKIIDIVKKLK